MSCAMSSLKFLSFVLNLICCIAGALIVSASAYALVTFDASGAIRVPSIIGGIVGTLLFATTVLGCCGALRDSVRLTWIYAASLFVLMLAQIAIVFFISIDFEQLASETMDNAWKREMDGKGLMASYEIKYECCGKVGPNDYKESGLSIPQSCYKNQNITIAANLYEVGCVDKLANAFEDGSRIENISDWSLIGVECVTAVLACMLAISFRNNERRKRFH